MTSFAAALSEPAAWALELYCRAERRGWRSRAPTSSDEPDADDERAVARGEHRDAVEQG